MVPLWVLASAALIRADGLVAGLSSVQAVPVQIHVPFWKVPLLSSPPNSSDPPSVMSLVMEALESPAGLPEAGVTLFHVVGGTVGAAPA